MPAAITTEVPHAARSMFALGGWQIISAFGVYFVLKTIKTITSKRIFILCLVIIFLASTIHYIYSYFILYPIKSSQEWQYGYKQLFNKYKSEFRKFDHIVVTDIYNQPYIFALYYLKYDPEKFRSEVNYNTTIRRKTSLVKSIDKFIFTNIDYYNLPNGKSLIFSSSTDKMDEIKPKDILRFLDGTPSIYVYEYEK